MNIDIFSKVKKEVNGITYIVDKNTGIIISVRSPIKLAKTCNAINNIGKNINDIK